MREPAHAAAVIEAMTQGGEDSGDGQDARRLERHASATRRRWRGWSRTPARRRSPSTAGPRSRATAASPTGTWSREIADDLRDSGVRQRRLRRARADRRAAGAAASTACWSAAACCAIRGSSRRPPTCAPAATPRVVTLAERGRFLLDYIELLLQRAGPRTDGFRHVAPGDGRRRTRHGATRARGHDRWVINKLRALGSWYTKGSDNGSHLRTAINRADSLAALREIIEAAFCGVPQAPRSTADLEAAYH